MYIADVKTCLSCFNDELEDLASFGRKYLDVQQEDQYRLPVNLKKNGLVFYYKVIYSLAYLSQAVLLKVLKSIKTDRCCSHETSTLARNKFGKTPASRTFFCFGSLSVMV